MTCIWWYKMYIYGMDLSLSSSGIVIFDENAQPVKILTIKTSVQQKHGRRLRKIAEELLVLTEQYPPKVLVCEGAFYRYPKATEALYKVHGVVNYLFYDKKIVTYAPRSVKAFILKGNSTKHEIGVRIKRTYPNVEFENDDESDAFAVGLSYFIDERLIKWTKNTKGRANAKKD